MKLRLFFVPVNTAMEFVRSVGAAPQSGLFNSLWAEALDTYDEGKCVTATSKPGRAGTTTRAAPARRKSTKFGSTSCFTKRSIHSALRAQKYG